MAQRVSRERAVAIENRSHPRCGLWAGAASGRDRCVFLVKAVLLWVASVLASEAALAGTPGEVEVGGTLRNAPLYGFAGDFRWLNEFRGKPLIINVWASWCAPCRAEMGSLERLSRRYGGKQFNIIGISTDDDADAAYTFIMTAGITFDNYLDQKLMLENMLGANAIPLTLLIDGQGRVLKKVRGAQPWDSPEFVEMIGKTFGVKL
jgi:thiol-disulfide isomerase/thioredoxin